MSTVTCSCRVRNCCKCCNRSANHPPKVVITQTYTSIAMALKEESPKRPNYIMKIQGDKKAVYPLFI